MSYAATQAGSAQTVFYLTSQSHGADAASGSLELDIQTNRYQRCEFSDVER